MGVGPTAKREKHKRLLWFILLLLSSTGTRPRPVIRHHHLFFIIYSNFPFAYSRRRVRKKHYPALMCVLQGLRLQLYSICVWLSPRQISIWCVLICALKLSQAELNHYLVKRPVIWERKWIRRKYGIGEIPTICGKGSSQVKGVHLDVGGALFLGSRTTVLNTCSHEGLCSSGPNGMGRQKY